MPRNFKFYQRNQNVRLSAPKDTKNHLSIEPSRLTRENKFKSLQVSYSAHMSDYGAMQQEGTHRLIGFCAERLTIENVLPKLSIEPAVLEGPK